MNQLMLFKNVDVKKLDTTLTELQWMIFSMKHLALNQEISGTSKRAFNLTLEVARNFAELCHELSDVSLKFIHMRKKDWDALAVYEPYYPALEPRSSFDLYKVALDYKSRCNALLLRLEAILKSGAIKVPRKTEEIRKNLDKVTQYLKYEGT